VKLYNLEKYKNIRKALRKDMTKAEAVFWIHIKNSQLGYRFRRQYSIGKYIVDFYCPELKLVVEIDGATHDHPDVYKKDQEKQRYLESKGFTVIRYNDEEILNELDAMWDNLYNICEGLSKQK